MKTLTDRINSLTDKLKDLSLLMIRIILAYGLYTPAMNKWADIEAIGAWFAELGLPAPLAQAYLAASSELAGVVLLSLGFMVRFISVPLMVTMCVAIKTVHLENGFDASNNGFEIPLYYLILLFTLFVYGSGRLSLDFAVKQLMKKKKLRYQKRKPIPTSNQL